MSLRINDIAPNFTSDSTHGKIEFHSWIKNSWVILFSHPKDFTPVCTTELSQLTKSYSAFEKRNCKVIGLSVDSVTEHKEWIKDIESISGKKLPFPLIGDENLEIAKLYNMLPADAKVQPGIRRTAG